MNKFYEAEASKYGFLESDFSKSVINELQLTPIKHSLYYPDSFKSHWN